MGHVIDAGRGRGAIRGLLKACIYQTRYARRRCDHWFIAICIFISNRDHINIHNVSRIGEAWIDHLQFDTFTYMVGDIIAMEITS